MMTPPRGTDVPNTSLALPLRGSSAPRLLALGVLAAGLVFTLQHGVSRREPEVASAPMAPIKIARTLPHTAPSEFEKEMAMSPAALMSRWDPLIAQAAQRFHVPIAWIRAVMRQESGGRTMLDETQPIISSTGAMGIMQVMPGTYDEMRQQYHLGADPYDPRNSVFAGAAYLRWLHGKYGYPAMFAAYNDGPGDLEDYLQRGRPLPAETRNYVQSIARMLHDPVAQLPDTKPAVLTRPDGSEVSIDSTKVTAVHAAIAGIYAPEVHAIISMGRLQQGVREDVAAATALLRRHGAHV